jgi:4-nitrophenyl phosphatase
LVIGKPNPFSWELIRKDHNLPENTKAIMIGDRLDTDITFGRNAGLDSCLVLTGCTTAITQITDVMPSYVIASLDLNYF